VLRFVLRRVLLSVPVLVVASILVFAAVRATTDPAGTRAPGSRIEDVQRVREQLALDRSPVSQYLTWSRHLLHGDLGTSLATGRPVWPDLRDALWHSAELGATAMALTLGLGLVVGVWSGLRPGRWFDRLSGGVVLAGMSVPPFVVGLLLQLVLVEWWRRWFGHSPFFTSRMSTPGESGVVDRLWHLALPASAVAVQGVALYARHLRSSMEEALGSDYVRLARASGQSERSVVLRHALRNALVPLTTVAAIDLGGLVGGLVVTEQVFQWPGMGSYFLNALRTGDPLRVLPWAMVVVVGVVAANLLADLLHGVLDPRVRAR
jgi:peptide/nickel transport system permease protein